MPTPAVTLQGIASRAKPQAQPDGAKDGVPFRTGRYQEEMNLAMVPKSHLLADEGSYFVASNPTAGTGVASAIAPTLAPLIGSQDTKPFFCYQNTDGIGGKRTYFDYIRFRDTATGGSAITPVSCSMDDGGKSVGTMSAGAVTVATTSTGRLMPNIQFRPVIP